MAAVEGEIAHLLDVGETIIFVGAGLSRWSGLPAWPTLISRLVDFTEKKTGVRQASARRCLQANDLLGSADRLVSKLSALELSQFLRSEMKFEGASPHSIHRALVGLGPSCFITTNFDRLVETELLQSGNLKARAITNRQLADFADIVRADARDFVFKIHGCITDASSLVLSETAYFDLILGSGPSGTRTVVEALKILFATRPVVFVGYGIRDLDLLLMMRHLQHAFDRNIGRYFAIMADLDPDDEAYLWETFRIRCLGYSTTEDGKNHEALLDLLERLASRKRSIWRDAVSPDEQVLAIARYGHRLCDFALQERLEIGIALRSSSQLAATEGMRFRRRNIDALFDEYDDSFVLTGPAGAGKSFAIRTFMSRCGESLQDWALEESRASIKPTFPVLLDARLYDGSFEDLAATALPQSINLEKLADSVVPVLIVDSIDEMPSEHLDAAKWHADLQAFQKSLGGCQIIFGTRRAELVSQRNLPVFDVLPVADETVSTSLAESNVTLDSLSRDIREVLRSPFGLSMGQKMLAKKTVKTPGDLFEFFVSHLLESLDWQAPAERVLEALRFVAYDALHSGRDTILIRKIIPTFEKLNLKSAHRTDRLVDRLVETGLLVSEFDGRVRFVHRSILEYLAGCELARRVGEGFSDLSEIVGFRRWDNALAWSASHLDGEAGERVMAFLCNRDASLALRVARNAEVNRPRLLSIFLRDIQQGERTEWESWDLEHEIEGTSFPPETKEILQELAANVEDLEGGALSALIPLLSEIEIRPLIRKLCRGQFSFNTCNRVAPALAGATTGESFRFFLRELKKSNVPDSDVSPDGSDNHSAVCHRHGIELFIANLSRNFQDHVRDASEAMDSGIRSVVSAGLMESPNDEDFEFVLGQWERGLISTTFSLFLYLKYSDEKALLGRKYFSFTNRRFNRLRSEFEMDGNEHAWALELTKLLCETRSDWKREISKKATQEENPFLKSAFCLCVPSMHSDASGEILNSCLHANVTPTYMKLFRLFDDKDFLGNWEQAIGILANAQPALVGAILDKLHSSKLDATNALSPNQIDSLLARLSEFAGDSQVDDILAERLGGFLASTVDADGVVHIVSRMNNTLDGSRAVLARYVVCEMPEFSISSDDLSSQAREFLLETYLAEGSPFDASPGEISSERWIEREVIPYLRNALGGSDRRAALARKILEDAGGRHGRRYSISTRGIDQEG